MSDGFRCTYRLQLTEQFGFRAAREVAVPYVAELGLDSGAGLPIHVFAEQGSRVRCVRAGAIADAHQSIVTAMLK